MSISDALWRAMPPQRLLDGGVPFDDVLFLQSTIDASWDETLESLARAHRERGDAARAAGHAVTAAEEYRAAVATYLFSQMPLDDGDRKRTLYHGAAATMRLLAERVEVPCATGTLVGWLVLPAERPKGTVVLFGGQSGWGATYLRYADALARRGIATILAEGPGQGETRLEYGVMLDVDVAAAFGEFVAYARSAPETAGSPVGVWGNSVGGLFAALTAARVPGIAAACVNGGIAAPTLLPFRTFREQAAAMLGTADEAAIQANFDRLRFDPDADTIACPLLVLHGGADPIVKLDDQQPFLDAASDRTLRIWDDGDHTIYNHSAERTAYVCDWFADRFAESS